MALGDRIEERRKLRGLSQAELARRVGVRQSTMNSLINGNSRTSRSLLQIAKELHTTPAYLLGETDDPEIDSHELSVLDTEEVELLRWFDILSAGDRATIVRIAQLMARERDERVHSPTTGYRPRDA